MAFRALIKRLLFRLALSLASEWDKPAIYARFMGVSIGRDCRFTGLINFGSEPELISVGNHVTLANGVTFHTHDGGVWVFRDEFPNINRFAGISIGDNVFIGANSTLLPGVIVESNVVIGACSVVTKSLRSQGVYAGNPAKMIRTLEDYKIETLEMAVHRAFDKCSKDDLRMKFKPFAGNEHTQQ